MTYGQGFQEDVYGRLDNTKEVNTRAPFIAEGKSRLMVLNLEPFTHTTHGPSVRCTFEVIQAERMAPGTRCCKLWNLTKPSKFVSQTNDADRFADFVKKLKGSPVGHPVGRDCAALLRDRVVEQLARGMVIEAYGVNTSKKSDKPYVDVNWTTMPQTADEIRARRQALDAQAQPAPAAQVAPAPAVYAAQPVAQPPQGGFLANLPPAGGSGGNQGGGW